MVCVVNVSVLRSERCTETGLVELCVQLLPLSTSLFSTVPKCWLALISNPLLTPLILYTIHYTIH